MTTEETAIAVRREVRYTWGGHCMIGAIVGIGALMLALGVHWTWTLLMIPISAEGALLLFAARSSKDKREVIQAVTEFRAAMSADHAEIGKKHARVWSELEFVGGEVAANQEELQFLRKTGQVGQARGGVQNFPRRRRRSKGRPTNDAIDRAIKKAPNVFDIEDARILRRIDKRLKDQDPEQGTES